MYRGFWNSFKKPVIALSPMDGVTDAPFRLITNKYGKPDLSITEFTSVEGICHGSLKSLKAFKYDESERPVLAQLFGSTPSSFYKCAFVIAELGFDGIDINMGCPANNVASKGAGASLILTPGLAMEIIYKSKEAMIDWFNGKNIEDVDLPQEIIDYVKKNQPQNLTRKILPVSVKTRIGYNKIVIEEWVKTLLEAEPANISIHGRTLKQLYSGIADWEAIAKAARLIHQTKTSVLGNGDIKSLKEAHQKIKQYGVDGVLIGRAALGNPWIFKDREPTIQEKFAVAIEHSKNFEQTFCNDRFIPMRKHLAWYCKGFPNASEIRQKLMKTNCSADVENALDI